MSMGELLDYLLVSHGAVLFRCLLVRLRRQQIQPAERDTFWIRVLNRSPRGTGLVPKWMRSKARANSPKQRGRKGLYTVAALSWPDGNHV